MSKARVDFPDPLSPVTTTIFSRGMSTRDVLQIVFPCSGNPDRVPRPPGRGRGNRQLIREVFGDAVCLAEEDLQKAPCVRGLAPCDFLGPAHGNDRPALLSRFRAEIDEPIGTLDDFHVVFDNNEAVAFVHEALEHAEQPGDIVEVQPRGGLVEDEQRARLAPFGEMCGELEALGFSPAECIDGLAKPKVVEPDIGEQLEGRRDAVFPFEKGDRIPHGHLQHVMDGPTADADLQDVGLKTAPFAFRAAKVEVAQELHFDLLKADARAAFATSVARVEGKR